MPGALRHGDSTGADTLALHLERYHWAAARLQPGVILDLACGVGYGSVLLADLNPGTRVVGADISRDALSEARRTYQHPRVAFVRGNGGGALQSARFDTIVSLETIEHVPDPGQFFSELVDLLVPGGRLIASVPVTPSVDVNPHHRTDFTKRSFLALGEQRGLRMLDSHLQIQRFQPLRILTRTEQRTRDLRPHLFRYYLSHPTAAVKRLATTLRHGFSNHYLTVAWQKP